jgi:tight adherence protein C
LPDLLFILLPLLVFMAIVGIGCGIALAIRSRPRQVDPGLSTTGAFAQLPVGDATLTRAATGLGSSLSRGGVSTKLKEQLASAGYYHDAAAATYLGAKFALFLIGGAPLAILIMQLPVAFITRVLLAIVAACLLFFLPNLFVHARARRRMGAIRNYLPDAVDLLEICVSSGMGLDTAWNAVSDEVRGVCPVLADEMSLVNLEVQLGASRTDAMRNMAKRTGADDLTSLVALLIQSDRFGTSIGDALRTFAGSMREQRSARAEEEAEKMAVKLLFPLVFFIFPVMLIVMVGPAGLTLYEVMGR